MLNLDELYMNTVAASAVAIRINQSYSKNLEHVKFNLLTLLLCKYIFIFYVVLRTI